MTKILYSDTVTLGEELTQIAYREGSIEVNTYNNIIYGYRVNVDGCWRIVSSNKYGEDILEKLKERMLSTPLNDYCGELAEAELYKGRVEIGKDYPDVDEILKLIRDLCSEAKGYNIAKCEQIVTLRTVRRSIERDVDDVAYELKRIVEIEIGLLGKSSYGLTSFSSNYRAMITWSPRDVIKSIDLVFKETVDKISHMYRLKPLKPYLYGRTIIVLDYTASSALFHEISHLFDPTYSYGTKILDYKLCSEEIEIYDEPHNVESPSIRFFDDEGVIAKKRSLVESGVVRDLHHTRSTAKVAGSEPGSAYGLFHNPVPFHTTLVVKSGDWKHDEILGDTKRGFYVCGIVTASLEEGYIRLIPEYGYVIQNGELKEAVKIREVKVSLAGLKTINAISRNTSMRMSYEKMWLVSEVAPMIRLEAFVQ
ncbi:MAG: metallopeptidase TldD-related protein [Ignisphaera sp.]